MNSEVLGLQEKLGTLEVGKLADVIVVDGDPVADIQVLSDRKRVVGIYKGCVPVPRLPM